MDKITAAWNFDFQRRLSSGSLRYLARRVERSRAPFRRPPERVFALKAGAKSARRTFRRRRGRISLTTLKPPARMRSIKVRRDRTYRTGVIRPHATKRFPSSPPRREARLPRARPPLRRGGARADDEHAG